MSPLKLLWATLADFHNEKTGQCNPSIKTLAACIEKSESQTTVYMGILKKLGLVVVTKNAKGGRFTPQYSLPIPSHPMNKGVNHPVDNAPEFNQETTPFIEPNKGSHSQDTTTPADRTRILIEPLDEPLIKSLVNEKNALLKIQGLSKLGRKYGFPFMNNTPMHEVETWLLSAIKNLTAHGISHGSH